MIFHGMIDITIDIMIGIMIDIMIYIMEDHRLRKDDISWRYRGGIMEVSWRYHGGIKEVSWVYHGGIMEVSFGCATCTALPSGHCAFASSTAPE